MTTYTMAHDGTRWLVGEWFLARMRISGSEPGATLSDPPATSGQRYM